MKEIQNQLAVKAWVFFCFNYNDINKIVEYICEKADNHIEKHLIGKFNGIYETCGSAAAMNYFYAELSIGLRNALVDYAIKVYAPEGLFLEDEEKELLGI